ncbi:hypothetical protein GGU11DRAFT_751991 [Lentinula aff. detonsa]|nr:hypothetical protein GGU11DRAFT_751991 [Lentinula aff. detonsa]
MPNNAMIPLFVVRDSGRAYSYRRPYTLPVLTDGLGRRKICFPRNIGQFPLNKQQTLCKHQPAYKGWRGSVVRLQYSVQFTRVNNLFSSNRNHNIYIASVAIVTDNDNDNGKLFVSLHLAFHYTLFIVQTTGCFAMPASVSPIPPSSPPSMTAKYLVPSFFSTHPPCSRVSPFQTIIIQIHHACNLPHAIGPQGCHPHSPQSTHGYSPARGTFDNEDG